MAKSKYDNFPSFDLNEACDHFDSNKQSNWKKISKFIVADGDEYSEVMLNEFDYYEVNDGEYEAFMRGVQYALTKMNTAFEAAGVDLQVCEADLGNNMGFVMTRTDDEPEDFVKRVLKKPVLMVDSWV